MTALRSPGSRSTSTRIRLGVGAADVEADASPGVDVEAELASDDDRERHRKIRARSLALVLVEDREVDEAAPLVESVEALPEADDALAGLQPQCEPKPVRPAAGDEPLDAGGDEALARPLVVRHDPQIAAVGLPARARSPRTSASLVSGHEPVAQHLAGREWRELRAPRDATGLCAEPASLRRSGGPRRPAER